MSRHGIGRLLSSSTVLQPQQIKNMNQAWCWSKIQSGNPCRHGGSSTTTMTSGSGCGIRNFHSNHRTTTKITLPTEINQTHWNTTTTSTTTITPSKRYFSKGWTGARGYDLTNDVYDYDKDMGIPKINVSGYDENGFMVKNMIQKVISTSPNSASRNSLVDVQNHSEADSDGSVYMNGSIIVYPTGCFLWNIPPLRQSQQLLFQNSPNTTLPQSHQNDHPNIISIESLSAIVLIRPQIEYLFIGCNDGYGSIANLNEIQYYFRHSSAVSRHNNTGRTGIVVEQMQLYNAIGTFNLLNAEDRSVAAALIVDTSL
jgi:Protein of unknown function (DUF498/DUF598)